MKIVAFFFTSLFLSHATKKTHNKRKKNSGSSNRIEMKANTLKVEREKKKLSCSFMKRKKNRAKLIPRGDEGEFSSK